MAKHVYHRMKLNAASEVTARRRLFKRKRVQQEVLTTCRRGVKITSGLELSQWYVLVC